MSSNLKIAGCDSSVPGCELQVIDYLQNTEPEKHEIVDETLEERSPVGYSNVYEQPLYQR